MNESRYAQKSVGSVLQEERKSVTAIDWKDL